MTEFIKSFAGIFLNRNSGYKPFNINQFEKSIDEIAIHQTVNQFNQAAKEVCIEYKK
ncbi:hypothetical protein [Polynucleobacter kasalickyi]|uniref:Uncharacterized protein n=1 Tax=Polynucleobacter kasalickyi TaxID=1938817 RepID=A0A1W1ZNF3_9BURK|nr:hypothetical protein [Polynucleobacter kasalickyi]SMC49752.1 hypothetical protein SAMN06296008_10630 [Polynucleobacter kasalickyi]